VPGGPDDFPGFGSAGWRLVPASADWPDWTQDEAYLAALAEEDEPGDLDLYQDPDNAPPPGLDDAQLAALIAEAREVTAGQARADVLAARLGESAAMAAVAAGIGRRGPGMPGSARSFPGEYLSRSAGFATGKPLDTAPGCAVLGLFVEDAAGDDDCYAGASDDELLGMICAWDRAETSMAARKHAAVAELIRRRPAPGCALDGEARMPEGWHEFTPRELAPALGESAGAAEGLLWLTWELEVNLPGTRAAFRSGVLSRRKAEIIAAATTVLDRDEARAAESLVLGRAGSLTTGRLRAAIARAVMEIAPDKAGKRREQAARAARVERWAEASGNAGLAGRELPSAEALAADQRVTWWARQLRKAGLDGGMDALRARALMDILLGIDSRPAAKPADGQEADGPGADGHGGPEEDTSPGGSGSGPPGPDRPRIPAPGGPLAGVIPPGFVGRVTLTIPLATLLGLADRPGEMAGIGPIDPGLARALAGAAARNPSTTWCVTVTDQDGHAIGHGCARPEPKKRSNEPDNRGTSGKPGPPRTHDPPRRAGSGGGNAGSGGTGNRDSPPAADPWRQGPAPGPGEPRVTFTAASQPGPPGGYGTWRLTTGPPEQPDLIVAIEPIAAGECDHRHQARGHDPGVMLRHLTQVRHATCTGPSCRRPSTRADFEHNTPYEAGGRTCLCNGNPTCRHDHRVKQDPRWKVEQLAGGHVRWTTPSGRQYTTEPTRYPI
jgi:hypothetical protein